ncbi:hypothetical protein [Methylobacterium sp. Leaf88]|uniref:hypothetical protein n=1 Tax=Methylobacterium sp. Leaf88 TaxID=1736244 RepID=UPI0006F47D6C|nr:hypothetical protein [Methylobacterium sp. Leaf88]KQO77855.1 hypothetical protein ASF20_12820 [Methylobacterium sp. Leaf88]
MGGVAPARDLKRRRPTLPVPPASSDSHILAQEDAQGFELLRTPYCGGQPGRTIDRIVARHAALSKAEVEVTAATADRVPGQAARSAMAAKTRA